MHSPSSLYDEHDPAELPPELQPLPEVEWGSMSSGAVQRLVHELPAGMLAGVPGKSDLLKGVLALGIGVRFEGAVVPTVAGLAVFGVNPERFVPGMRLCVAENGRRVATGSAGRLSRWLAAHALGARVGEPACRALVAFAFAWRSWDSATLDRGLQIRVQDGVLSLWFPGPVEPEVRNPVLADLLHRAGLLSDAEASVEALGEAVDDVSPGALDVRTVRDGTMISFPLVSSAETSALGSSLSRSARANDACSPRPATARQSELVRALRELGPCRRRDLQEHLGWSRSTLRNVLRAAVEADEVTKHAEHSRSPFQVYEARPGPVADEDLTT